jgi:hypothetical protein
MGRKASASACFAKKSVQSGYERSMVMLMIHGQVMCSVQCCCYGWLRLGGWLLNINKYLGDGQHSSGLALFTETIFHFEFTS